MLFLFSTTLVFCEHTNSDSVGLCLHSLRHLLSRPPCSSHASHFVFLCVVFHTRCEQQSSLFEFKFLVSLQSWLPTHAVVMLLDRHRCSTKTTNDAVILMTHREWISKHCDCGAQKSLEQIFLSGVDDGSSCWR